MKQTHLASNLTSETQSRCSVETYVAQASAYDSVIDVRTPSEFALDALPNAVNWPVLSDRERAEVGTLYKQQGAFEAKKIGAMYISANISKHLKQHTTGIPRTWKPLVYCWRGGGRSFALSDVLQNIGWHAVQLIGGYKAYRRYVNTQLQQSFDFLRFHVLCGKTGCGKTKLLQTLAKANAQVLNLEALANHRGSVLGLKPGAVQPSQKHFENCLWQQLRSFDPRLPVWVESESKKVGTLQLPETLLQSIRSSPCFVIDAALEIRIQHLLNEYAFFLQDHEKFIEKLRLLIPFCGHRLFDTWYEWLIDKRYIQVVKSLLVQHYDPIYARSIERNFTQMQQAQVFTLTQSDDVGFQDLTNQLLQTENQLSHQSLMNMYA